MLVLLYELYCNKVHLSEVCQSKGSALYLSEVHLWPNQLDFRVEVSLRTAQMASVTTPLQTDTLYISVCRKTDGRGQKAMFLY